MDGMGLFDDKMRACIKGYSSFGFVGVVIRELVAYAELLEDELRRRPAAPDPNHAAAPCGGTFDPTERPMQATLWHDEAPARSGAVISPCGAYRYKLTRFWDRPDVPGWVNFVMLNPSTADANLDDPTIRRCVGFAKSWGYGGLVVTNLFAFRATDPAALKTAPDPVGPDNDAMITAVASGAALVVCGWGNHGAGGRSAHVLGLICAAGATPYALRLTGLKQPTHPLYLPAACRPFPID